MTDMTEKSEWKKALRESNAIGWIAFLVLVFAIGVGTIMFSGSPVSVKAPGRPCRSNTRLGSNMLRLTGLFWPMFHVKHCPKR